MPKATDTREKTRAAHALFVARGETPSARQILRHIGGGSLSTITDELAKIGNASAVPALPSPSPTPTPEALPAEARTAPEIPVAIVHELANMTAAMRQLVESLGAVQAEVQELRNGGTEQLRVAYERYEAVQRLALQQVDLARQEARDYKARLAALSMDYETREDAMRGRAQQLRDENQRLLGRIEELSKP